MAALGLGLGRGIGVRSGEGPSTVRVATLFALLEAGRGFGEIGVETLVQGRYGPTGLPAVLPFLYMGLGAIGLVMALAYTAALGRVARGPLFVALLSIGAVLIVVLRIALGTGIDAVLLALWLTVYTVGALIVTMYWTVAGATFDARQAKRLFPVLTAAAIAGTFVGSLAAGPVAALIGAENLVVIEAAALAIAVPLMARLVGRAAHAAPGPAATRARRSVIADVRVGFDVVAASPLLKRVAIAYVLLAILMFSVQYPFTISVAATFPDAAGRATALGILSAAVTATSFLVSILVANRVYARFGVSAGAVLLPIVYVVGFGVWLVAFSFPTAAAFRFTQQVAQRGLSNSSWSAFYNVVPAERRAQVLAFNDGIPGQLGTILVGVLLLAAGRILTPDQLFWVGLLTALVAILVVVGIRRGYGASLVDALRSGTAEQVLEGGPGVEVLLRDPSVEPALIGALRAPEPGVREMAVGLLSDGLMARARPIVRGLLDDPDPRVRVAAIRALARRPSGVGGTDAVAGEDVDLARLADDPDPRVRGCRGRRACRHRPGRDRRAGRGSDAGRACRRDRSPRAARRRPIARCGPERHGRRTR